MLSYFLQSVSRVTWSASKMVMIHILDLKVQFSGDYKLLVHFNYESAFYNYWTKKLPTQENVNKL